MDSIEKNLLEQVADIHGVPEGAMLRLLPVYF